MKASPVNRKRLYSLDVLRGFDMFWIIGGEHIIHAAAKASGTFFFLELANQFTHPNWNGFHVYDLIFPLFIFISGAAMPYATARESEKGTSKKQLFLKIIRRGIVLVLLGIIYNNGLQFRPMSEIRFPSVLGRIGLAYMFSGVIYLFSSRQRTLIIWAAALLLSYWVVFMIAAAPGARPGDLTFEGNFVSYFDRLFMPGRLYWGNVHDPEGLVATIPAISTGLIGIITGHFIKNSCLSDLSKFRLLVLAGTIMIVVGQVWNVWFPINKNLWTSSFVLHTGGISITLLAIFYFIIDVKGIHRWAFFFSVIGVNSILIYLLDKFIDWEKPTRVFFEWIAQFVGQPFDIVGFMCCMFALKWLLLYFLYQKKVFLRV